MASSPLVTVCVPTYQHAKYINQCLESILSQSTNFLFEVLIGDDGSTDGTTTICQQWAEEHSDRVRLIVHDRNAPEREKYTACPGSYNWLSLIQSARGEFIAICEGDDYWSDPLKLQTQADFLMENLKFSACFHAVEIDTPQGIKPDFITANTRDELSLADLANGNCIHTPSIMYRNVFEFPLPEFFNHSPVLDYPLHCYVAGQGNIKFLNRKMANYRVHPESYWSSSSPILRTRKWFDVILPLITYFSDTQAQHNFKEQLFRTGLSWLANSDESDESTQSYILTKLAQVDSRRLTQEMFQASQVPVNMIAEARAICENLDETLPNVIGKLLAGRAGEKLKRAADKSAVLLQMLEDIISSAIEEADYSVGKKLTEKRRNELSQAYQLINEQLDAGQQTAEFTRKKDSILQLLEHDEYQSWIRKHELREVDAEILAERMMLYWHQQPTFHCFMFVLPGEEALLADSIDSLAGQLYKNWQLTVVAGTSTPDPIFEQVDFLHWRMLQAGEDPYQVLNQEISHQPQHWVSFIEPGMQYSPHSLAKIGDAINLHPTKSFFYTDDDYVDESGMRSKPRFKPDFNIDLLRSSPYIGNGWVSAEQLIQLGGLQAIPGAENYDLALRWFDSFDETAFHHVADVLTHKSSQVDRPFDSKAGEQVLSQHFERQYIEVDIEPGYVDNTYRVKYQHQEKPKVSIIVPTKDKLEFLQPCIESLLDKTKYDNYEVLIVDNQSTDPDTLDYYEQLKELNPDKIRVLFFDREFNFAEMNNWAADQATGEYLLLLNNDTEIIQADWLERLLTHGQREDVGIVGARLIYPGTGRVQHVGVILGINFIADHPYNNFICMNDSSHMERARLDQNLSAVTAAVMLVRKSLFLEAKGMDAKNLSVLYNDIDLCLRVRELGYKVVYTPFSMVVHHGSTSLAEKSEINFFYDWKAYAKKADRTREERSYMLNRWLPLLASDPAYNPNLSLQPGRCSIEVDCPLNWDRESHLRLRVYGVPINGGSGDYRMKQPFHALSKSGMAMCEIGSRHLSVTELARMRPDTLVFQNGITDKDIELMMLYKEFSPDTQIIFLLDDLLHNLPEKSSQYKKIKASFRDARSRLRRALSYCDRLVVSTRPLAELCQDMIKDIHIIPNRLRKDPWLSLNSQRNQADKPRVGWAGAQQHQGDLEIIIEVVKETAEEVDWIFFGMCPEEIKPFVKEEHGFVDIESYPEKLASLNLDLAVAPLEEHDFNIAKSNLRLLEYGILGWPVICSDIYPYQTNDAPVIRVANNKADWLSAIRQILADPSGLQQAGDDLKVWVKQYYLLEDHLDEWFSALATTEFRADKLKAGKTLK